MKLRDPGRVLQAFSSLATLFSPRGYIAAQSYCWLQFIVLLGVRSVRELTGTVVSLLVLYTAVPYIEHCSLCTLGYFLCWEEDDSGVDGPCVLIFTFQQASQSSLVMVQLFSQSEVSFRETRIAADNVSVFDCARCSTSVSLNIFSLSTCSFFSRHCQKCVQSKMSWTSSWKLSLLGVYE